MIHRRPKEYDYFNPDLCGCNKPFSDELTLQHIVDHFRPSLDYLKPLRFLRHGHDIGRVVRVAPWERKGVVT